MIEKLSGGIKMDFEVARMEPLFENRNEYEKFENRHSAHEVKKGILENYEGKCFLGIDAGSTTTKTALISEKGVPINGDIENRLLPVLHHERNTQTGRLWHRDNRCAGILCIGTSSTMLAFPRALKSSSLYALSAYSYNSPNRLRSSRISPRAFSENDGSVSFRYCAYSVMFSA